MWAGQSRELTEMLGEHWRWEHGQAAEMEQWKGGPDCICKCTIYGPQRVFNEQMLVPFSCLEEVGAFTVGLAVLTARLAEGLLSFGTIAPPVLL